MISRFQLLVVAPDEDCDVLLLPLSITLVYFYLQQAKNQREQKRMAFAESATKADFVQPSIGKSVTLAIVGESVLSIILSLAYAVEDVTNQVGRGRPGGNILRALAIVCIFIALVAQKCGALILPLVTSKALRQAVFEQKIFTVLPGSNFPFIRYLCVVAAFVVFAFRLSVIVFFLLNHC